MGNAHYPISQSITKLAENPCLLYISSATYEGDWDSEPHSHTCTELFYVVGGKGGFQIENQMISVRPHDLIVVNPNVLHTEVGAEGAPLEYIVLGLQGFEMLDPEKAEQRYYILNFEAREKELLACMKMMVQEARGKLPGSDSVCQNLLQVLIVLLMRASNVSPKKTILAVRRECATAKWYMDHHFKEKITLDLLAQVAGVNKYYLAHSFTAEYGIPPIKYLLERRITESKFLLSSTDIPLNSIVRTLCFSSVSHFSQIFRRSQGMTPSEYRKQYRAK